MSSSSSDSDSDDVEPIRRIKINIKPKDPLAGAARQDGGADIEAIKASVGAWRPLGPRPHVSLTRRQSSLSSMSSLSFGTGGPTSTTATPNSVTSGTTAFGTYQQQQQQQQSGHQFGNGPTLAAATTTTGIMNRGNITPATASSQAPAPVPAQAPPPSYMRSSPSCSSLVNEFSNRASFSQFMSSGAASRTSSPLTLMGGAGGPNGCYGNAASETSVPIALAIQESIELTVRGQRGQPAPGAAANGSASTAASAAKTRFETRALGNIKVAFPNSFARLCSTSASCDKLPPAIPALKLRLHSTENIVRYYASGLVRDLDSETSSLAGSVANQQQQQEHSGANNNNTSLDNTSCSTSTYGSEHQEAAPGGDESQQSDSTSTANYDLFDMNESPVRTNRRASTKVIEFDMEALVAQLKQLYDQTPGSRYFNVDVLRYQITPLAEFERCPLQVCAYWKVEPKLIKLRVDFKHSSLSGLPLERLREISFTANLAQLVPASLSVQPVPPNLVTQLGQPKVATQDNSNNNNRDSFRNLSASGNTSDSSSSSLMLSTGAFQAPLPPPMVAPQPAPRQINNINRGGAPAASNLQIRLPPPPSSGHSRNHHHHQQQQQQQHSRVSNLSHQVTGMDTLRRQPSPFARNQSASSSSSGRSDQNSLGSGGTPNGAPSILDQLMSLDQQGGLATVAANPLMLGPNPPPQQRQQQQELAPAMPTAPYITYEPQAHWDNTTKQLVWRFDNLLSFYKSEGYGSLLAKLDFRQLASEGSSAGDQQSRQEPLTPEPIDVKFMVVDSTLSKVSLSIDSAGYRMSLLKREVRSGRYKSEPYIF